MMTYVIIVNDNGELKTVTEQDVDRSSFVLEHGHSLEEVINEILDKRSAESEIQQQQLYEAGVKDGISRAREGTFQRGDPGHPDNEMGM